MMKMIFTAVLLMAGLISETWAMMGAPRDKGEGQQGGFGGMLILFLPLLLIWYFLLIRPQQKKEKDKKRMLEEIRKGDRIMTIGGIYGQVVQVKDNRLVIKVSEKTNVEVSKSAVSGKVDL